MQTWPPSHPALVHGYLRPRLSHFPSSWLQMIGAMRAQSQVLGGRCLHARSRRSLDELRRRPQEVCQRRFDSLRSAAVFGPRGQVNETQWGSTPPPRISPAGTLQVMGWGSASGCLAPSAPPPPLTTRLSDTLLRHQSPHSSTPHTVGHICCFCSPPLMVTWLVLLINRVFWMY